MNLKQVSIYLKEEEYEALRKKAFEERRSMSDIIREGVDFIIKKGNKDSENLLHRSSGD